MTRKELSQPGVYFILHVPTGAKYFGDSTALYSRMAQHKLELSQGMHKNPKLRELNDRDLCNYEFHVVCFEKDKDWRYDMEKAMILLDQKRFNVTPSLINFKHDTQSVKAKVKYWLDKSKDLTPISMCYKTK